MDSDKNTITVPPFIRGPVRGDLSYLWIERVQVQCLE